jgi:hypothetical protein
VKQRMISDRTACGFPTGLRKAMRLHLPKFWKHALPSSSSPYLGLGRLWTQYTLLFGALASVSGLLWSRCANTRQGVELVV